LALAAQQLPPKWLAIAVQILYFLPSHLLAAAQAVQLTMALV
jgi:hypothetical protein